MRIHWRWLCPLNSLPPTVESGKDGSRRNPETLKAPFDERGLYTLP